MQWLDRFWAGAIDAARYVDVAEIADRAGGYCVLSEADQRSMEQLGVPDAVARAWCNARPLETRGVPITLQDPRYPRLLASIERAPPVLFVEGCLDSLRRPAIAVVGTRSCSEYGRGIAARLGGTLGAAGVVVVSGLARGIDASAHRAASAQGATVGVLGHGLGFTAPRSNERLRREIVSQGGAMLTTWPDSVPPRPHRFPIRNRWIAGLCSAIVVVEAGYRSGALITAREAADLGRLVFAVPGPLGAPASEGCNRLIGSGALCVDDVEDFVWSVSGERLRSPAPWLGMVFAGVSLDEVALRLGGSVPELIGRLSQLELEGMVVRTGVQRYAPGRRFP